MGYTIDASQHYLIWNNTEAVTLTSPYKPPTPNKTFPIAVAKRRNPQFKEQAPTGGVYGSALMTWWLPATLVTAAGAVGNDTPTQAFLITDGAGVVWTIQDVRLDNLKSTWHCPSLNLTLAFNLRDTLTLQRPVLTTDAAGGRTYPTYTVIATGIACRFQETTGEPTDERGKRLTVHKYDVPVGTRLFPTIEDQVIDGNGVVYEVKGWRQPDRIDQLQVLECERRW